VELVSPDQGQLNGDIYVLEPMGREQVVDLRFGESALRVLAPANFNGQIGDRVGVRIHTDRIHIFEPASGDRLN
jgi:ABC-type sugar transport system ATPase subunit